MISPFVLLCLLPTLLALPSPAHLIQLDVRSDVDSFSISSWALPSNPSFEYLTSRWPASIFTKTGGFSPWFPSTGVYGVAGDTSAAPDGCTVDQVQLYMRHAERLASGGTHTGIQALATKLANASFAFKTDDPNLQYLQSFTWTVPAEYLSPLGTVTATAAGAAFLKNYGHLMPDNAYYSFTGASRIPVRSTDQSRVKVTAEAFVAGMLGPDYASRSTWLVTPDSSSTFNSTLAPATCPASSTISSSANGIFTKYLWALVRERLFPLMPGFNLTTADVQEMMNACPFDSFLRQSPSPICFIFTEDEWKGWNYQYDLTQFDNAGYGGPIGTAWGVGWVAEMIARLNHSSVVPVGSVNTTLDSDPSTFPLNASIMLDFTHDTSLESAITAMGLLKADYNGNVTLDQIDPNRAWQSAHIAPMGGRLVVERLTCQSGESTNGTFVRLINNEAVLPLYTLAECEHSWGADRGMCELQSFIKSQIYAISGAGFANCYNNYTGVAL